MVQAYLNVYSRIITQAVFFRNPLTMLRFGLYNTQRYKTRKAVTKTVFIRPKVQRAGGGGKPVRVGDGEDHFQAAGPKVRGRRSE